jgi:hypothetical protein
MDKTTLIDYFSSSWQSDIKKYKYSGDALLDKVTDNDTILDVGCGFNYFKGKIKNLVGIDIANKNADIVTDVLDYTPEVTYDVIFCLGSINFGKEDIVYNQCKHVVDLLSSNGIIYWRCNPGLHDHKWNGMELIDFFPWSFELHEKWSRQLGCELLKCVWDTDDRIYAEWRKL